MAKMEGHEVGFPMGEYLSIINSEVTVEILPDYKDGKPTQEGVIKISIPYKEATVETSVNKPLGRLFSVCNIPERSTIFSKKPSSCTVRFSAISNTTLNIEPGNCLKELSIVIEGEGPKKNSIN